jgi:hypothetical protein
VTSKNYIVNQGDKGWYVKRSEGDSSDKSFPTQQEAIEYGKKLATKAGGELTVFGRDGKIVSKDSYGNDPREIKDTEH